MSITVAVNPALITALSVVAAALLSTIGTVVAAIISRGKRKDKE